MSFYICEQSCYDHLSRPNVTTGFLVFSKAMYHYSHGVQNTSIYRLSRRISTNEKALQRHLQALTVLPKRWIIHGKRQQEKWLLEIYSSTYFLFLFLAQYEAHNPIMSCKLKLLKKSDRFQLFDTTQNQQQVQDIVCKIRDHTFV